MITTRKLQFAIGTLLLPAAMLTACSDSNEPEVILDKEDAQEIRVVKEGMETYTQLLVDGEVREQVVDKVYNFGEADFPLLFHVTQSHTLDGVEVPEGPEDLDCAFLTMNMEEHERFINFFANTLGIADGDNLTDEERFDAVSSLSGLLYSTGIELPLIVYLTQDNPEQLRALMKMSRSVDPTRSFGNHTNDLNDIARAMLNGGITPVELLSILDGEHTDLGTLLEMADRQGYMLAGDFATRSVLHKIKLVIKGLVCASKVLVAIIEGSQPVVNLESTYAAYLCEEDTEPLNYYGSTRSTSQEVEFRYGTSGAPLAQAKFYIEAYVHGKHKTIPGEYITRVGMIVTKVVCSGGMHVEGDMECNLPSNTGTDENPVAYVQNLVKIDYGDCCCFSRHGTVMYGVAADKGITYIGISR